MLIVLLLTLATSCHMQEKSNNLFHSMTRSTKITVKKLLTLQNGLVRMLNHMIFVVNSVHTRRVAIITYSS